MTIDDGNNFIEYVRYLDGVKPRGGKYMRKRKPATAALLGLLFAGGTILAAGTASASVTSGQHLTTAPSSTIAIVTAAPERPRCHWVHGRWRWDYRRGHRVWVPRHRVCWR
jgi:hypothetical protein